MKRNLLIVFCATISSLALGQGKPVHPSRFQHHVMAGINIGALAPVGLPNTIRKVEGFSPLFNPAIGYQATYQLHDRWGVSAGLKLEYKGMKVKDSVLYFHTIVTTESGGQKAEFEGDFTGHNSTTAHNLYLTIPINAVFTPGKYWQYHVGAYFAFLLNARFEGTVNNGYIRRGSSLNEKVTISEATFDFKNIERNFDVGVQAGAARSLGSRFGVTAQLSWGLIPIFPSTFQGMSFSMYNIFATVGVSYRLFQN